MIPGAGMVGDCTASPDVSAISVLGGYVVCLRAGAAESLAVEPHQRPPAFRVLPVSRGGDHHRSLHQHARGVVRKDWARTLTSVLI